MSHTWSVQPTETLKDAYSTCGHFSVSHYDMLRTLGGRKKTYLCCLLLQAGTKTDTELFPFHHNYVVLAMNLVALQPTGTKNS